MSHLYRIAKNTFCEAIREPVYFLMLLIALLLTGHFPWMTLFVFFEQLKLVVDSSMATAMLFGILVAELCASHTVSREMRNGTVLLLLSKPVPRWSFVLGKIAGIVLASLLFCMICCCASVISVYIAVDQFRMDLTLYGIFMAICAVGCVFGMAMNFIRGSSFSEFATYALAVLTAGMALYCYKFQPHPNLSLTDLAKALTVVNLAVVVMATMAVVVASRFDVIATLCICTAFFFLGLMSSYLFAAPAGGDASLFADFCYALIPNWQFFWLADALAVDKRIPAEYVKLAVIYTVIYCVILSAWGVAIFQNREAAGDNTN